MAEEKSPESGICSSNNHPVSARAALDDDLEPPIISLSKSSTYIASDPSHRTELAWCRQHLRKSASTATYLQMPSSKGGPVTGVSVSLETEQVSTGSSNNTPETGILCGGTMRPRSIDENSPARRTQEQHWGRQQAYNGQRSALRSPSMDRDLRMEVRETCCQCCVTGENLKPCNRMVYGMLSPALGPRLCLRNAHSLAEQEVNAEFYTQNSFKGERHQVVPACKCACVNNALRNTCAVVPCSGHLMSFQACAGNSCAREHSLLNSSLNGFPPLVSSVSETRLNKQAAGHCCGPEPHMKNLSTFRLDHTNHFGFCHQTVKDASNMTSIKDFREVGVQTMSTDPLLFPPSNVFREISTTSRPSSGGGGEDVGTGTSVKEVEWDAEGMTWEVYGAGLDPEELGLAIQRHLELQIKEIAAAAAQKKLSAENNVTATQEDKRQRKSGTVVRSLCRPGCCSQASAVEDCM